MNMPNYDRLMAGLNSQLKTVPKATIANRALFATDMTFLALAVNTYADLVALVQKASKEGHLELAQEADALLNRIESEVGR